MPGGPAGQAAIINGPGGGAPATVAVTAGVAGTRSGLTQITLTLSAAAFVQVRLLNLAGREIAVLPEQPLEAGTRTLFWNGRATSGPPAPPGQYVLSIEAKQASGAATRVVVPLPR